MSSTVPPSSLSADSVVYLPIDTAALDVCASICHSSFNSFNRSVALPPEFPSIEGSRGLIVGRISRPTTFHLMAVRRTMDRSIDNWVDGVGEVLGVVMMDTADEVAGLGPLAVSTAVQSRGVGRGLMERCMEHVRQRRIKSLRLIAIVANIASFSLYHSLGFRACDYMVVLQGHIDEQQQQQLTGAMKKEGVSVRAMARDDVAVCDRLHVATNSVSRLRGITFSFESQPSQQRRKQDGSEGQPRGSVDAPTTGCYVAVAASGAIVGYCTGWVKNSHLSAALVHTT